MTSIRPLDQLPKVWQLIEKKNKDGKVVKFIIQEIPEDRYDDAMQHMCTYFLADAPTRQCLNAMNDPLHIQDISMIWRLLLQQGISIAAFIDNPNNGKPTIAGMNILSVAFKNQEDSISGYQFKSKNCKNTCEIVGRATKKVFEHFAVDKYLYGFGMAIDPKFRGYGLSKTILKIRDLIAPMYKVPATSSVFTSTISQKSGAAVGFEEFLTQNFAELVDKDGKEYFPGINSKAFKIMGKKFC